VAFAPGGDAEKMSESVVRHSPGPSAACAAVAAFYLPFRDRSNGPGRRFSFDTIAVFLLLSRNPITRPAP
jgi:hypothetical protein